MRTIPFLVISSLIILSCETSLSQTIDYHWRNVNAQSLIGVMNHSKTIVSMDGSLSLPNGVVHFITPDTPETSTSNNPSDRRQSLENGYLPMVRTEWTQEGITYETLDFGALIHDIPVDIVRIRLSNSSNSAKTANLLAKFNGGDILTAKGGDLYSGNLLIAHPDTPQYGVAQAFVSQQDWGNVEGWSPSPGWAHPLQTVDPSFRNITIGFAGKPIIYAFHAKPNTEYTVDLGFCEGYWSDAGKRIMDISIDGKYEKTIDPVQDAGFNIPMIESLTVKSPSDGWVRVQVQANPKAQDQNCILNAIWIYSQNNAPNVNAIINGTANATPLFHVSCGSSSDQRLSLGGVKFQANLQPGKTSEYWIRFPLTDSVKDAKNVFAGAGGSLLDAAKMRWNAFFAKGAQFQTPSVDVNDFYKASLAYTFLMRDKVGRYYVVKPGATVYNAFWYRDGSYITHAHDIAGYPEEAERDLRVFIHSPLPDAVNAMGTAPIQQQSDGAWNAPATEWDGQGQALWAIVSHYELTGDTAWLQTAYPAILRGAEWIRTARQSTSGFSDVDTDHYGIFPVGFGEAITDGQVYCYYHDFWGVLGIREAALAAQAMHRSGDAAWMSAQEKSFTRCLLDDVRLAALKDHHGREYIPGAPGQPGEPNEPGANIWGDIAAIYPCEVMNPQDPLIVSTMDRMWDRKLQDEYQFITHYKIWTYITADWIQALWLQGHPHKAWELFVGYLNHAYPTKSWCEEMFPDTMIGTGDQPHGWAAANMVLLMRNMLVREDGGYLDLLYGAPKEWVTSNHSILVDRAPTTLGGPISFTSSYDAKDSDVTINISQAPQNAEYLRVWIRDCTIDKIVSSSHPVMNIGKDYVDLPSSKGIYKIQVTP